MSFRITLLAILLTAGLCHAQEVAFRGQPQVRFDSDGTTTKEHDLSQEGAEKYECKIVGKGKRYYWASRGNRELIRTDAGDYTYYVSPEGTGYVKIYTGKKNPNVKMPYDYLEHFSSEMKVYTYWGKRAQ